MPLAPYINRVIHGDCLEVLRGMPDSSINMIFADPPYGVDYAEWDYDIPDVVWVCEAKRLSPLTYITPGNRNHYRYPAPNWTLGWFRPGSTQRADGGGFSHWEPILLYGKNPMPFDAKRFNANTNAGAIGHPCPKPLDLLVWIIEASTAPGDIILDPFCGSGTTLVAAKMLGRRYIGIDIEKQYCDIAEERLRNTTPPLPFVVEKQEQGCLL